MPFLPRPARWPGGSLGSGSFHDATRNGTGGPELLKCSSCSCNDTIPRDIGHLGGRERKRERERERERGREGEREKEREGGREKGRGEKQICATTSGLHTRDCA